MVKKREPNRQVATADLEPEQTAYQVVSVKRQGERTKRSKADKNARDGGVVERRRLRAKYQVDVVIVNKQQTIGKNIRTSTIT